MLIGYDNTIPVIGMPSPRTPPDVPLPPDISPGDPIPILSPPPPPVVILPDPGLTTPPPDIPGGMMTPIPPTGGIGEGGGRVTIL